MSTTEPRFEITFTSEADSDDFKTLIEALEQEGYDLDVDLSKGRVDAVDREDQDDVKSLEEGEHSLSVSTEIEKDSDDDDGDADPADTGDREDPEEDEDAGKELECPECGKAHDSLSSLSGHMSRSKDHDDISSYFTAENDGYSCPEHSDLDIPSRKALSTHFQDEHEVSLLQYLIENYGDLNVERDMEDPDGVDDGGEHDGSEPSQELTEEDVEQEIEEQRSANGDSAGFTCPDCGEEKLLPEVYKDHRLGVNCA